MGKHKKDKKQKKKKAEDEQKTLYGYTNESNPFNDPELTTKKFVWAKKVALEKSQGVDVKTAYSEENTRKRKEALIEELERVKKRRLVTEAENTRWIKEKEEMEREANMIAGEDFVRQEEEFVVNQIKSRSRLRWEQERARNIDLLFLNMQRDLDVEFCMEEPFDVLRVLSFEDLQEAKEEGILLQRNDKGNEKFWNSFLIVCDDLLLAAERTMDRYSNKSIDQTIENMLRQKTSVELEKLEKETNEKLSIRDAVLDVVFWERLIAKIKVAKAKTILKEKYVSLLKEHLKRLEHTSVEKNQEVQTADHFDLIRNKLSKTNEKAERSETSGYSPILVRFGELSSNEFSLLGDPTEDWEELLAERKRVLASEVKTLTYAKITQIGSSTDDLLYNTEASYPMGEDEEVFENVIDINSYKNPSGHQVPSAPRAPLMSKEQQIALINDKYRPRKPRFYNRVITGYDWNKFNRSHYDHDNPPPKTVKGYKFNIFYPDLIDTTHTPQFSLKPDPEGGEDFCLIQFHAGPPYEDIAFRIVNRRWNRSHRSASFKNVFENGVLHLWFTFERFFYKR